MSCTVYHNTTNISSYVVSYTREKNICDGIGRVELKVSKEYSSILPWDTITIYEGSQKVGTFFVSSITKNELGVYYSVVGQDGSKKLTDYFLLSKITPKNSIKRARELIQDILNEVGITHTFTVSGNGAAIAPDTEIGLQSAYEAILSLVQQSGWYFYFDKDNVCKIGKLKAGNAKKTIDTDIIEFSYNYNDSSLRNKAIVWGGFDKTTGKEIFYSKRVHTPYDRHKKDIRSVVLSNAAIHSLSVAKYLANLLLATFSVLNKEKTIKIAGYHDLEVGDVVKVALPFINFKGIITALTVDYSSNGIVTTLLIDKRCPRLFAWFEWGSNPDYPEYVYVGTNGSGVKRKPIGGSGWTDFSSGLQNLVIKDLRIYSDNFICVADDGYAYIRTDTTSWRRLNPGSFFDSEGKEYTNVKAVACAIDQVSGDFYVGYNYYEPYTDYKTFRSWVACFNTNGQIKYKQPVEILSINRILINDLDRHSANTFIAGISDISAFLFVGNRDAYPINSPELSLPFVFGPQIISTSGGINTEKYEENGSYIYSGAFLSGNARSICSFIQEDDFSSTHTLYDNGKIFKVNNQGILIYDFSTSGITKSTGFPIRHTNIVVSGLLPPLSRSHRFLHLEKKPFYPELHLLLFDTYWGNSLFHAKYTFTDYSYLTLSGATLLHNGDFISPELGIPYPYYLSNSLVWNSGDKEPPIFCNNGVLLETVYSEIDNNFNVYIIKYDLETQQKESAIVFSFSSLDNFPQFISKFYDIPDPSRPYGIIFVGCGGLEKVDIGSSCPYKANSIKKVIDVVFVYYKDEFSFSKQTILEESISSVGSCNYRVSYDPYIYPEGNITWLLGSRPETDNNGVRCLGYSLPDKAAFVVYSEIGYHDFVYIPSVSNPCCFKIPPQPPDWCWRLFYHQKTFILESGVLRETNITLPNRIPQTTPLIVPSGFPISCIRSQPIVRGNDYFIMKIDDLENVENIQIPVFHEWGGGVIENTCSYIDFFDKTIYFFINAPWSSRAFLYGIDYDTGILKKNLGGFFYNIVFGEKWENVPPIIHNGTLFRRGAFWIFNTTVTGYFVYPIMYQNPGRTNIINVEILPTNVDASKSYPYVTYNPFEYELPLVSGELLSYNLGKTSKIYSVDFTSYLVTSKTGNDERVFDLLEKDIVESGNNMRDDDFRYIAIPENNTLFVRDVEFNTDFTSLKTVSNTIYHIETSNLPDKPFIFMSQESPAQFIEYDKEVWRTFSSPAAKILTIRVDDLL